MGSIDKKVRIRNEPINVNGKMLVGYDLFNYVFRRQKDRKEKERKYGIEPSPYDCGGGSSIK